MYLTPEQERLSNEGTPSEQTAMKLLVTLGEIHGAGRLIPITWAHISGASYLTIGDTGLEFLKDFCLSAHSKVKATVNPISIDIQRWSEMGIPKDYVEKQMEIVETYRQIGVEETFSCTPYLIGNPPSMGEHLAWAESSAAIYANSILGARTNREGGPSALASAVTGVTPEFGLHLDENRLAGVKVEVKAKLGGIRSSLLGLALGSMLDNEVPYLPRFPGTDEEFKWFGASLASVCDMTMFHVEKRTPEWRRSVKGRLRTIRITEKDLKDEQKKLNTGNEAEAIGIGSPQLSSEELEAIARIFKRYRPKIPVWVFSSRDAIAHAAEAVKFIESRGGKVWADTCLEVSPLYYSFKTVATPSGKGAYYLPSLCRQKVVFEDLEKLFRRYA